MTNTHQVQKEMNITRQILNMYLPYWPLFLLLLVASFIVAKIYLNYATPVYEATARIMIKDEKKGAQGSKAIEAFDVLSSKKIIENEIEVIRSRTLIDQVAKKLHLYAPVYQEQQFSKRPAYSTSPVSIQVADAATIKETKKIPFTYNAQHSAVVIGQQEYPLNVWVSTPYGKLQFTPNKYANNTANTAAEAAFFFSLVSPGDVTTSISNRLDVSASNKMSSIIDLTLRDEVPKRAEDILNELVAAYNYEMVKDKSTLAVNTLEFLDERLARVEHELDSVEK
ncbi:MAG TPA: Wzz/FepE/Etk N-terminal domain-containing protein, partial [Chitinophagaceae bacterium]|nr:Wzz/FepE/Etk N-terminal domain-containing protein [Chitinophagaceae bacterium]